LLASVASALAGTVSREMGVTVTFAIGGSARASGRPSEPPVTASTQASTVTAAKL
jgi:hypothetical protein